MLNENNVRHRDTYTVVLSKYIKLILSPYIKFKKKITQLCYRNFSDQGRYHILAGFAWATEDKRR